MKYLLLFLYSCLIAEAQSFKVYELLVPKDKIESFSNPREMIDAVGHDGIKLIAFADLNNGENGLWSIDQAYSLEYAEEFDHLGEPITHATRKIGLQVSIKQQSNGQVEMKYSNTKLEEWIPIRMVPGAFQPIFSTGEMTTTFVIEDYVVMGGLVTDDGVLIMIIHKIKSE